jgi:hypothetical protein
MSEDENILIDYLVAEYDKTAENKINALYPNRNVDLRTNYLNYIMSIDPWIHERQSDTSLLKTKIDYYDSKTNKQLGSDLSGEYLITLDKPYKNEYKYMTLRFMTRYYKVWVYTFIFYKTVDAETLKNCREQTLYSLIIKKDI